MGGHPLADNTPLIPLRIVAAKGPSRSFKDVSEFPERTLPCDPQSCWSEWQKEILQFQCDWRVATKEIVLEAQIRSPDGPKDVRVLVDTGARIPIAFRTGLLDATRLLQALFPVRFSMADGQPMNGGSHGAFLEIRLPVRQNHTEVLVRTAPLFAYEAPIVGSDLIIGYPFLKVFGIMVDTIHDCLSLNACNDPRHDPLSDLDEANLCLSPLVRCLLIRMKRIGASLRRSWLWHLRALHPLSVI